MIIENKKENLSRFPAVDRFSFYIYNIFLSTALLIFNLIDNAIATLYYLNRPFAVQLNFTDRLILRTVFPRKLLLAVAFPVAEPLEEAADFFTIFQFLPGQLVATYLLTHFALFLS